MNKQFSDAQMSPAPDEGRKFDLLETLSFTWRQWKLIGAITAISLLVGTVFLMREVPLYTATSQVLLERPRQRLPGGDTMLGETNLDAAMVQAQMAIIRSTVFLSRVVERERLAEVSSAPASVPQDDLPYLGPIIDAVKGYARSVIVYFRRPERSPSSPSATGLPVNEGAMPPEVRRAVGRLGGAMTVSLLPQQGYVLAIAVTDPDPIRAARLANAISDAYLVDKLDTKYEAARRASAWLSDRLLGLREQVRESEEAVAQFRATRGLVQAGNLSLTQQQLSDINTKLIEARADLAQKKTRVDLITSLEGRGNSLQNMPDFSNSGMLPTLRQQAANLSTQEADLLARYSANHPLVVNIQAQLRDLNRSIGNETKRLVASIRNEYDLAQARVASLEASLRKATGLVNNDDATGVQLRELERTAAVNKTLFEEFLKQTKITEEQSTFGAQDVRVITPASPPGAPSYPRKVQFVLLNLLIGLALGIAGAVAREMLSAGFMTPKQVEELLGLPVLASVSRLSARDRTVNGSAVPPHDFPKAKPLSRYGEAIRSLRSGIQMTDVDHRPRVIQVTSAVPGEGKTTIALSIAASAASAGMKVLLIDGDLRHPSASKVFNMHKDRGLVELLLGENATDEVIKYYEGGGYWALPAGGKTQNPTDLLGSGRMKTLVAAFREAYDLVIIDSPPVGPVSDPIIVSQLCDKIVFIVRWARTARELIKECVTQFSGHRKVAGIVFNMVNDKQAQKYGKYAYSYYYGSRYYKKYYRE